MADQEQINVCHVYAQPEWHEDAKIVLNRSALENLMLNLKVLLDCGREHSEIVVKDLYTTDGEGFDLRVVLNNDDWQAETWQRLWMPYTNIEAASLANIGKMPAKTNTIKTRGRGWHRSMALVNLDQARQYRREKRAEGNEAKIKQTADGPVVLYRPRIRKGG